MFKYTLIIFLSLLINSKTEAQNSLISNNKNAKKIGLFVPLYLDSVFKGNSYRYGKKFPRFALQGLEFIQGAEIAMDSFPIYGQQFETFVYDIKSDTLFIDSLILHHQLDSLDLMIGAVKDEDLTLLAAFAKDHTIPFVSVTYPNDGGIRENPYYFILNPTLKTHCESIFSYLLQSHSNDHILLIRKSGPQEERIENYINNINQQENHTLLNINTIVIDSNYNIILNNLDSTKNNIIIGGSLDEEFAKNLVSTLKTDTMKYHSMLIGMPNWGGFSSFGKNIKPVLKDFPFYFTAPYFNEKIDSFSKIIQNGYLKKYKGYPGDFTYKGFETYYYFSRLINESENDIFNNLNAEQPSIFSRINLLPVFNSSQKGILDYYENKHLFLLKKVNGKTEKLNK